MRDIQKTAARETSDGDDHSSIEDCGLTWGVQAGKRTIFLLRMDRVVRRGRIKQYQSHAQINRYKG